MRSRIKNALKDILGRLALWLSAWSPDTREIVLGRGRPRLADLYIRRFKKFGSNPRIQHLRLNMDLRRQLKLELNTDEFTQFYYFANFFEADDFALFRLVQKYQGGVFLDVGANVGLYSLAASHFFDQVYAFEPFPDTLSRLKKNVDLNGLKNIQIVPLALSAELGVTYIKSNPRNLGNNFIADGPGEQTVTIQKTDLDTLIAKWNLPNVDLIKMDIEGHEVQALQGAKQTLEKYRPDLYVECKSQASYQKISSALPQGYRAYNPLNSVPIVETNDWLLTDVLFTAR